MVLAHCRERAQTRAVLGALSLAVAARLGAQRLIPAASPQKAGLVKMGTFIGGASGLVAGVTSAHNSCTADILALKDSPLAERLRAARDGRPIQCDDGLSLNSPHPSTASPQVRRPRHHEEIVKHRRPPIPCTDP